MKKFSYLLSVLFVFALFAGVSVQTAEASILSRILKTMDGHRNAMSDLQSNIRMVETDTAIDDKTSRSGTLKYVPRKGKNARVRIDWKSPNETLLINDDTYIIYRRKTNEAIQGSVSSSNKKKTGDVLSIWSMSKKQIQERYDVVYLGLKSISGTEHWHLRLTPKPGKKDSFKVSELYVNKDGMPIQAMVRHKNDDETAVRLSSVKTNSLKDYNGFVKDLISEIKRKKAKTIRA